MEAIEDSENSNYFCEYFLHQRFKENCTKKRYRKGLF